MAKKAKTASKAIWGWAALALAICVALTAVILSEFVFRTKENYDLEIELAPEVEEAAGKSVLAMIEDALGMSAQAASKFEVVDENETTWTQKTKVEIFKLRYNETGEVTVESASGADKLIAPGTHNDYTFTLKNSGSTTLDYTMTMRGWYEIDGLETEKDETPVEVRVKRGDTYILGDQKIGVSPLLLKDVNEAGTMKKKTSQTYTLEWEWPFERGNTEAQINKHDAEDTALGNEALEHDIEVWIEINTTAEGAGGGGGGGDGDGEGDSSKTGDEFNLALWLTIGGIAVLAMILIPLLKRKRKNETGK